MKNTAKVIKMVNRSYEKINESLSPHFIDFENPELFPPPSRSTCSIVALVTRMLCDALESRLKENAGVQGKLANAIIQGTIS